MKDKRKKEAQLFLREYNNNNNNVSSLILPPVAGAKLPMAPPPYISLIDAPQGYKKEKKRISYFFSFHHHRAGFLVRSLSGILHVHLKGNTSGWSGSEI